MPLPLNPASKLPAEQYAQANTVLMNMFSNPIYDDNTHHTSIKNDLINILAPITQSEISLANAIIVTVCYHDTNLLLHRNDRSLNLIMMDSVKCPISKLNAFKQAIQEKFPSAIIFALDPDTYLDKFETLGPLLENLFNAQSKCIDNHESITWVEEFQLIINTFEKHPNEMQDALAILPTKEQFYLLNNTLRKTMPLITKLYAKDVTSSKLDFRINLAEIIMSCYRLMHFSQ